jgi:diguanylate cyclase (GGDEF)-like protein/PAS domain S-box-containing protein
MDILVREVKSKLNKPIKKDIDLNEVRNKIKYAHELAKIGSWAYDLESKTVRWIEGLDIILESSSNLLNSSLDSFLTYIHEDDLDKVKKAIQEVIGGKECDIDFKIITPGKKVKYISGKTKTIYNEEHKPIKILGILQDITEKKELEIKLKQNQEKIKEFCRKYRALIKETFDVLEILDADGTIVFINEASEKVLGYRPEERIGKKVYDYYCEAEAKKLKEMINNVTKEPRKIEHGDIAFRTKEGKQIYLDFRMENFLHDPAIKGIVVNFRNITDRVEMEKRIKYLSVHDQLTGLPNNLNLKNKLSSLCNPNREIKKGFALYMLDVDNYKFIKDTLGFNIGEKLIFQMSRKLRKYCEAEYLLYRYSEDRFVILIEGISSIIECENRAKEIIGLFTEPILVDKYEVNVVVSMGIDRCDGDEVNFENLITHAETALFLAKNGEKNSYKFYTSDVNIQTHKQFELRKDLRQAIANGQLMVYYQPIVNIRTNEIIAAEALIRWNHPDWGIISPNEFIPMAEEMGFVEKLGYWVLREVCKNYRKWIDIGLPQIKVSINFSSLHFFESNFIGNVKNIIDEFQLDPKFLVVEITESILMVRTEKSLSDIRKFRELGIQIALDDFGTGYSSLSYLNSFDIDILKLDESFIKNIASNKSCNIIAKNIIRMAQELNIKLVSEGIEKREQLEFLREVKCNVGQGYLYNRPVAAEYFEKLLRQKVCNPKISIDNKIFSIAKRRKFFRVKFYNYLEAWLTILEINSKKVNVGNTKVLIKNIGPGGLCFISNIDLPVRRDIILRVTTELIGEELNVQGCSVWKKIQDDNLYEYGVEFSLDENERTNLIRILNNVQIKMKNNPLFADGSFVASSPSIYFKTIT